MKTRIVSTVALVALVLGLAASVQADVTYNAAADFSITNGNPNGAWSYGTQTDAGVFTAATRSRDWTARGFSDIQAWDAGVDDPSVTFNSTNAPLTAFGFTWAPKSLAEDGYGTNGTSGWSTVRWTAPATALYDIAATFTDMSGGISPVETYVVVNGAANFVGHASVAGVSYSAANVSLAAGDYVAFISTGNSALRAVTGVDATVTSHVPEPSVLALLVTGLLGLLCYVWRKRK
jgi:hypothetical protein